MKHKIGLHMQEGVENSCSTGIMYRLLKGFIKSWTTTSLSYGLGLDAQIVHRYHSGIIGSMLMRISTYN